MPRKARRTNKNLDTAGSPPAPESRLRFVDGDPLQIASCWSPPPGASFKTGRLLAQQYLAFVRDGLASELPGGLIQIVSGMAARGSLDRVEAGDGADEAAAGFLAEIDAALRQFCADFR